MARRTTTIRSVSAVDPASLKAIREIFAEAKKLYEPGGGFMKGTEAQIARGQKRTVASGMQSLAAAGLASTSMAGGLGKKYEEEVAQPMLARATSARLSALSGLLSAEAGAEAQLASRTTTQYTTTPVQGSQWAIPRRPGESQRTMPQPQKTQAGPSAMELYEQHKTRLREQGKAKKAKTTSLPSLNIGPSLPDPVGTWQATIGGTSFYTGKQGGQPTVTGTPLGSYYRKL